jgi:DHA2 family multidrug resistance protein
MRGASGLFNLTRNLGGAVGLAIINTLLTNRQDLHYFNLRDNINWGNQAAVAQLNNMATSFTASGLDGSQAALRQMVNMTTQQAMIMSFSDIFLMLTVLFLAMILGVLMLSKPKTAGGGGGGGH